MLVEPEITTEVTNTPKSGANHKSVRDLQMDIQTSIHDARAEEDFERIKTLRAHPIHRAKEEFEEWAARQLSGSKFDPFALGASMASRGIAQMMGSRKEFESEHLQAPYTTPAKDDDVPTTFMGETW